MKREKRYPDNIVWDEETQRFNSFLLPYGTNLSAPKIEITDINSFKEKGINKIQKIFDTQLEELNKNYYNLIEDIRLNEMVYNSKYSFEPLIGHTYHLYRGKDGNNFLSLISPLEWNKEYILSVKLNSEHKWVSTKDL
jgi:hypothetical protein